MNAWVAEFTTSLAVSLVLFAAGFLVGKYRQRSLQRGRNLEQYDFYPFKVDAAGFPTFDLALFRRGVDHLLGRSDRTAAAHMIVIGEQNGVRYQLEGEGLARYETLYARYHGARVLQDSSDFLENYRRIVRQLGATFRGLGMEIVLHDLLNPARSITCIAGGEVTGRVEGMGTTSLVIDLKRRRILNQDKVNYLLEIGARRFKCTTIPILREPYGIVGAVCLNIDVNYVRDHVLAVPGAVDEFFRLYAAAGTRLDENILSRDEYDKALAGKRHWRDEPSIATGTPD